VNRINNAANNATYVVHGSRFFVPIGEKMKIEIPKKDEVINEEDVLPQDEVIEEPKNREHELEVELARKEGELAGLKKSTPAVNPQNSLEQTKQIVFADTNNLSDEDFHKKYNMNKHGAMMTVMDQENKLTKAESRQMQADIAADQALAGRYGQDFYKFQDKIREGVADLSEEVRQDPVRLQKAKERLYLASVSEMKRVGPAKDDPTRRKIVTEFEKPKPDPIKQPKESADAVFSDDVPTGSDTSDSKLARNMGLTSKEEAKNYQKEYVPMNLGGGYKFEDPKRGFERDVDADKR
jgi:hypothetical protein